MKIIIAMLFMLTLASCSVKQDTAVEAANTPGNGVSGSGSSGPATDTRIFDQGFELPDDLYISFNECTYGEYCEILINYNPDPVMIVPDPILFPDAQPYEDTSMQMMCVGDVIVHQNGTMTVSDTSGNKAACADFDGDYDYAILDCGFFTQKNWYCGTPGYPYALSWQEI